MAQHSLLPRSVSLGLIVVGLIMAAFGIAEIITAFRHDFFGLSTSQNFLSTVLGAALGTTYVISGFLSLLRRYWSTIIAAILLVIDVVGRVAMVLTGFYPVDTLRQGLGIVLGTGIAAALAIYLFVNSKRIHRLM